MIEVKINKINNEDIAFRGLIRHNNLQFLSPHIYLKIKNTVYESIGGAESGVLELSNNQRLKLNLAINDIIKVEEYNIKNESIKEITFSVSKFKKGTEFIGYTYDILINEINKKFPHYYFYNNQRLLLELNNNLLILDILTGDEGFLSNKTTVNFYTNDEYINIIDNNLLKKELFQNDYKFEQLGIGGLDMVLQKVFTSLSTRAYKPQIIEKLGIKHAKGMLLYGPPGTGKTLIARNIGKMLSNNAPKIINGPELLNKFVGSSEENLRNIFTEARNEYNIKKDQSSLHIIIFDEIDAIFKHR